MLRRLCMVLVALSWMNQFGGAQTGNPVSGAILVSNQYVNGSTTPHSYKIATLVADNTSGLDHLHILVTINSTWAGLSNSFVDAVFGNRTGFAYSYTLRGAVVSTGARLVAYRNSDSTVDIYINFPGTSYPYTTASYIILENQEDIGYSNPVDYGANPAGTLIFDSSSAAYPPSSYVDFSGNTQLKGNLKLTPSSGSSITFADGTVQSTAYTGVMCGGDYAESVDVSGDRRLYGPGDVMVIDPEHPGNFLRSNAAYSTMAAGIYSTKPGVLGRRQTSDPAHAKVEVPMAMIGIVPAKVSAENGPIAVGDLLVTSSTMGYAMKGTDQARMMGAVLGKALAPLEAGTGVIEVLVTLQ